MSAWKDEYKNRWPAEIRRKTYFDEVLSNFDRSERALTRRIFWNRFFEVFYYALLAGISVSALWFALSLFGVLPR